MSTESSHDQFWEFWQSNQASLHQQSLRLTRGNIEEAKELVSTAMLRAAQKFPRHSKNIKNIKAWLHRLLHNIYMDALRQRQQTTSSSLLSNDAQENQLPSSDKHPSPEELLLCHEHLSKIWRQVQALPEALKAPIIMRFCESMSYDDIAARLKLTKCNARKRVQLACERLRHGLAKEA